MTPYLLLPLVLTWVELPTQDSPRFAKDVQKAGLCATVRVINSATGADGSGTVVGTSGPFVYVLTAKHVVAGAKTLEIHMFSAASHPKPAAIVKDAKVEAVAKEQDLALLHCAPPAGPPVAVRICPLKEVPTKAEFAALSVGCKNGEAPSLGFDAVKGARKVRKPDGTVAFVWEIAGEVAKGRSGGPLLTEQGLLIGIASGTGNGKAYFCHIEDIHDFLRQNGFRWLTEEKAP